MNEVVKSNKRFLLWTAEIYLITIAIVVVSAWMSNMHPYEMKLTVSKYIGLQQWTALLYLIMCLAMCTLMSIYILKTKIHLSRKIVYFFVILQVMGCALFPSMGKRNKLSTSTHKDFAYTLIFGIVLSFLLMLINGKNIKQRLFSICGLLYAGSFTLSYLSKLEPFRKTVFIWENVFIFLLLVQLSMEDPSILIPSKRKNR